MSHLTFELINSADKARRGRLTFPRGTIETPAFMPVGTYGTVKSITPEELISFGAEIVLGNTFHLMLRPGTEIIKAHGDLLEARSGAHLTVTAVSGRDRTKDRGVSLDGLTWYDDAVALASRRATRRSPCSRAHGESPHGCHGHGHVVCRAVARVRPS